MLNKIKGARSEMYDQKILCTFLAFQDPGTLDLLCNFKHSNYKQDRLCSSIRELRWQRPLIMWRITIHLEFT